MEKTTPKINYRNYRDLCEKLDKSIKSKDEKNIAISGIIGSGKSSLVATYKAAFNNKHGIKLIKSISKEDLNNDDKCEILNNKLENLKRKDVMPSLTISLANFNITNKSIKRNKNTEHIETENENNNQTDNKADTNNETKSKEEIDTSKEKTNILKKEIENDFDELNNFRYCEIINENTVNNKNNANNKSTLVEREIEKSLLQQFVFGVKQSKISDSKISRVVNKQAIRISAIVFFILTLCFGAIFSINHSSIFWEFNKPIEIVFGSLGISTFITTLSLLAFLIKIKTIKYDKIEIAAEDNNSLDENLLNKFIDEIVYIFKQSDYRIVFFEDLDRLPDLSIFNKLREINYILNNNPDINHKITFVYCVSDDIISDYEQRAKFFDNIITIKPYVTIENLKTTISEILTEANNNNIDDRISEYATDMSKFMVDARLSKYIKNDFNDLKNKYNKFKNEITVEELIKIYTLAIYKNLYYFDYNKISKNQACLCKSFDLIRILKKEKTNEIEKHIEKIENKITSANDSILINTDYMFTILISGLCDSINTSTNYNYNKRCVDISNLNNSNINNFDVILYRNKHVEIDKIKQTFKQQFHISLDDYINKISINNEDQLNELRLEIETKKIEIKDLNTLSVSQYISKYGCKEINNEFIYLCLKKGYIEGDYKKYLFGVDDSYLDESDEAFVEFVNHGQNNSPIQDDYLYPITENAVDVVIKSIYIERFNSENILNINLYNYIKKNRNKFEEQYQKYISLIKSNNNKVLNFFKEYLKTQDITNIIDLIKINYDSKKLLKALLLVKNTISDEKFISIANYLLNGLELNNLNNEIKEDYINFCNSTTNWKGITINNLNNIEKTGLIFLNIAGFNEESLKLIINNNLYDINYNNLLLISRHLGIENENKILETLIIKNNNIREFVINNFSEVINVLQNQEASSDIAEIVLKNIALSNDNKILFIEQVKFSYKCFSEMDLDLLNKIIEFDKLEYDIKSIYNAYKINANIDIGKYFQKDNLDKINFDYLKEISQDEQFENFKINVINPILVLSTNNIDIANRFEIDDLDLNNMNFSETSDVAILRLINNKIIKLNIENLNKLQSCPKSYMKLVENNFEGFLELTENANFDISPRMVTYLVCKSNLDKLRLFLINNYYTKIDFNQNIENENSFNIIIKFMLTTDKLNNQIIQRLFEFNITDDLVKEDLLNIINNNKNNLDKHEKFELVKKLDTKFFENFIVNYEFPKKQPHIIDICIKWLKSNKIIKLENNGLNYVVAEININ